MSSRAKIPFPVTGSLHVISLNSSVYAQSVGRGLAVLGCFTPERYVLGIAELADQLGMSRSTTHRYVITLVALGFLEQDASRKYRLSLRVSDLGMSALNSTGLRGCSRSFLEQLRFRTSYTASLSVLEGAEILYVERVRSFRRGQYMIDLNLRLASRLPVYCTAMGKVLLASLDEVDQYGIMAQMKLVKRGPRTITSRKALLAELEHVSQKGFAVNDEELASGLVSIAVPVRSEGREAIAAINMAAHTDMISLEDMVAQSLPHLFYTADQISASLGFRRDDK